MRKRSAASREDPGLEAVDGLYVLRAYDRKRWKRLYQRVLLPALIADLVLTVLLFTNNQRSLDATNRNAKIQRQNQYVSCVQNQNRNKAISDYFKKQIVDSKADIEKAKHLTIFQNPVTHQIDPQLLAQGTANQRRQINEVDALLAQFPIRPYGYCLTAFGPAPPGAPQEIRPATPSASATR